LGKEVGRIDLIEGEAFVGALLDGSELVTQYHRRDERVDHSYRVRKWDSRTFRLVGEIDLPNPIDAKNWSPKTGFVIFDASMADAQGSALAVSLKSGLRIEINSKFTEHWGNGKHILLNQDRPWAAQIDHSGPTRSSWGPPRVAIIDLESGMPFARFPIEAAPGHSIRITGVEFSPDSDLVSCTYRTAKEEEEPGENCFAIWKVSGGPRPLRQIKSWPYDLFDCTLSSNGRVACIHVGSSPIAIAVFDVFRNKLLLEDPPPDQRTDGGATEVWPAPRICPEGRLVVNELGGKVYRIADEAAECKLLWSWDQEWTNVGDIDWSGRIELETIPARPTFRGRAEAAFAQFVGWKEFGRYTVRDLRTGATLYSCDEPSLKWPLTVLDDGTVVRIDPVPRWGLIAFLQSILAAPLVAVWGLLRWRRARDRKRMATA
jgi:hypothetical protein